MSTARMRCATSAPTAPVGNVNDAPTGGVSITGTASENQTLTAVSTLADADGLGTISYQWLRNGAAIEGATGSTYILGDADVGTAIAVRASYTDGGGTAESATSARDCPGRQRQRRADGRGEHHRDGEREPDLDGGLDAGGCGRARHHQLSVAAQRGGDRGGDGLDLYASAMPMSARRSRCGRAIPMATARPRARRALATAPVGNVNDAPTYGTLSVRTDGTWTYALDNENPDTQALIDGETRQETFTFKVTDATGKIDTESVVINVAGRTDNPTGGQFDDTLRGDRANNVFDGGDGFDEAIYFDTGATTGIVANLSGIENPHGQTIAANSVRDGMGGTDLLIWIEDIWGPSSATSSSVMTRSRTASCRAPAATRSTVVPAPTRSMRSATIAVDRRARRASR